MVFTKWVLAQFIFLFFLLITVGCSSGSLKRCPSSMGASCEELFKNQVKSENSKDDLIAQFKLVSEFLPASLTDAFWDTVIQLSENNNSRVSVSSSEIILTKNLENKLKIHSTYGYDTASNSFLINKIEYSTVRQGKQLLSNQPLNNETHKLSDDLFVDLFNEHLDIKSKSVQISERIPYDVYKKISNEILDLNEFTAFELNQIAKMDSKSRSLKYIALAKSRRIKNYIFKNMMEDFLYKPTKTILISIFSFALITSQTEFLDHVLHIKKDTTPAWVAPSIVKMAVRYPSEVQTELVSLMKQINAVTSRSKVTLTPELNQKSIVIDESDKFSFQQNPKNNKTYFFVTHELENGQLEVYALEIQASRYPHLMSYYNLKSN